MTKDQRDGLILILLASAGFAFMPTLVKTIYAHSTFEPMDVALWRFIFATPLIWTLIGIRNKSQPVKHKDKLSVIHMMILGVLFFSCRTVCLFWIRTSPREYLYCLILYLPRDGRCIVSFSG